MSSWKHVGLARAAEGFDTGLPRSSEGLVFPRLKAVFAVRQNRCGPYPGQAPWPAAWRGGKPSCWRAGPPTRTLWVGRQFPQFPQTVLPIANDGSARPNRNTTRYCAGAGRGDREFLRTAIGARRGVSALSALSAGHLTPMDEPTAGCARHAGGRRPCCDSQSVGVDEGHADPFSTKVGRHKPQHCSGLSSQERGPVAVIPGGGRSGRISQHRRKCRPRSRRTGPCLRSRPCGRSPGRRRTDGARPAPGLGVARTVQVPPACRQTGRTGLSSGRRFSTPHRSRRRTG